MKPRSSNQTTLQAGDRIGRWTIIAPAPATESRQGRLRPRWLCRCDCGSQKTVLNQSLVLALRSPHGGSRSCGCYAVMVATRHSNASGVRPTAEYTAWLAAKKRCENPKNASYPYYGGRGVSMCPSWANDFGEFLRDMGRRPSPSHSLDRIDPEGDYTPGNCRWVLPEVQARNKRITRWYLFQGEPMVLAQVAAHLGVPRHRARTLERKGELPAWPIPGIGANRIDADCNSFINLNDALTDWEDASL